MLGERLMKLRKAKNWTQTDLAEQCGVSRNSIVNWETDKREPKIGDIQKLAEVLGVSPNDLICDTPIINTQAKPEKQGADEGCATYWVSVLDNVREAVERGDMQQINIITPLLKSALALLSPIGEHLKNNINDTEEMSAYNGNNSSYSGNIFIAKSRVPA